MIAAPINACIKVCRCCGAAYDSDTWAALPLCGYVGRYEGDSGEQRVVELRHCACMSTIAIDIEMPRASRAA